MKTDKRRAMQHPKRYKSRDSYFEAKIREFNVGLEAFNRIEFGSGYLPKNVREDLYLAKKILYDAACNLVTFKYKNL